MRVLYTRIRNCTGRMLCSVTLEMQFHLSPAHQHPRERGGRRTTVAGVDLANDRHSGAAPRLRLRYCTITHASTRAGPGHDDISVSTIDVSALEPEEAIAKLVAQNNALTQHAGRMRNLQDDNRQLRADSDKLTARCRELEADLSRQREVLDIAKAHHRCAHAALDTACLARSPGQTPAGSARACTAAHASCMPQQACTFEGISIKSRAGSRS